MKNRVKFAALVVSGLALMLAAGCTQAEPLVPAMMPDSHPPLSPRALEASPMIKDEPETAAMQKVTEETRRKYFQSEIDRAHREADYYRARQEQSSTEASAPQVIYNYEYAPNNTVVPAYYPPAYYPTEVLPANCSWEQRRCSRLPLFNEIVFGTLGGIIGHQTGHRDAGIAIGLTYGLLHDLVECGR